MLPWAWVKNTVESAIRRYSKWLPCRDRLWYWLDSFHLLHLYLSGFFFITTVVKTNKLQKEKCFRRIIYSLCVAYFTFTIQCAYSLLQTRCLWLTQKCARYCRHQTRCLIVPIQGTLIESLFLSLFRPHHYFVYTPHGRGRHLRWSHCHHLQWQAALLRLLSLPKEMFWQRLLPHSGPRWHWKDDGSA